jgi:hypothetical protein
MASAPAAQGTEGRSDGLVLIWGKLQAVHGLLVAEDYLHLNFGISDIVILTSVFNGVFRDHFLDPNHAEDPHHMVATLRCLWLSEAEKCTWDSIMKLNAAEEDRLPRLQNDQHIKDAILRYTPFDAQHQAI